MGGVTAVLTVATAAPLPVLALEGVGQGATPPAPPVETAPQTPAAPSGAAVNPGGGTPGGVAADAARAASNALGAVLDTTTRRAGEALEGTLRGGRNAGVLDDTPDSSASPSDHQTSGDDPTATPDAGSRTDETEGATTAEAAEATQSEDTQSEDAEPSGDGPVGSVGDTLGEAVEDTTGAVGGTLGGTVEETADATGRTANAVVTGTTATVDRVVRDVLGSGSQPSPSGDVPELPDGAQPSDGDGASAPLDDGGGDGGPTQAGPIGLPESVLGSDATTAPAFDEPGETRSPSLASLSPLDDAAGGLSPLTAPGWLVTTATLLLTAVSAGHLLYGLARLRAPRRIGPGSSPAR